MTNLKNKLIATVIPIIFISFLLLLACNKEKSTNKVQQDDTVSAAETTVETLWNVKARLPDGNILDVKAIDADGNIHDVKAVQNSEQINLLDIKAFVNGKSLSVKILTSSDKYLPVKAIDTDSTIVDIKALTNDGQILDVKGVGQSGNIVHIKAINNSGEFYNIEAISPKGWINDVKGVKMFVAPIETTVYGIDVYAHIKAIPQVNLLY
jgi:hypothetical protein